MDGDEWVIDTGTLIRAFSVSEDFDLDAMEFALSVLRRHRVALDFQGNIEGEYLRNLRGSRQFWAWWSTLWENNKVVHRDGRLPNRYRRHLTDRLKFDRDDLPFVAVASRGDFKLLATEDSDYDAHVRDYLSSALGVAVLNTAAALERASG